MRVYKYCAVISCLISFGFVRDTSAGAECAETKACSGECYTATKQYCKRYAADTGCCLECTSTQPSENTSINCIADWCKDGKVCTKYDTSSGCCIENSPVAEMCIEGCSDCASWAYDGCCTLCNSLLVTECPDECKGITNWQDVYSGIGANVADQQVRCNSKTGACEYRCGSDCRDDNDEDITEWTLMNGNKAVKCVTNNGVSSCSYTCAAGYMQSRYSLAGLTCDPCPDGGITDNDGAAADSFCYITTFSNEKGVGEYTDKCEYSFF